MDLKFYPLIVDEVVTETPDTVSIFFKIHEDLKDIFKYREGQYLTLKFKFGDREERRAYSMSSSPYESRCAVTVKKVEGGIVSSYIHDQVKSGMEIEVMPPQGKFFAPAHEENRKTYYLIGAGSGITPLFSILKTVLEREPQSSVFLLYGSRNEEQIIFKKELDSLQEKYQGQFSVTHVLSQPEKNKPKGMAGWFSKGISLWDGKTGRISGKLAGQFLEDHPAIYPKREFFICGPGDMIEAVEAELKSRGIDSKNIHKEHFFVDRPEGAEEVMGKDKALVVVHLSGRVHEVTVPKEKTILDVLIDADLNPPYSCTSGACSTCMAKVLEGKVEMETSFALDDHEIEQGYILTCQAHPLTSKTIITFDE
jgi:ring-1,2-phenylacetyl-CoA epoxidase subunit PaaE